jgi:hypothetical protein
MRAIRNLEPERPKFTLLKRFLMVSLRWQFYFQISFTGVREPEKAMHLPEETRRLLH